MDAALEALALDLLRGMEAKIDRLIERTTAMNVSAAAAGASIADMREDMNGGRLQRLDRMEQRLDRIERRLDVVPA